jgi:hypothetical protein
LRFATSTQAVRALLSPDCIGKVVEGIQAQTIRWEGNFLVFLWFYALTRRIAPIGRQHRRRRPLPHPYLAHDPSSPSASCITVEAPQRELDRGWHAAWEQRPKLLILRVASGEPTQQFSKAYCHNQPSGSQRPCPGVAALYLGQNHQAG